MAASPGPGVPLDDDMRSWCRRLSIWVCIWKDMGAPPLYWFISSMEEA